MTPVLLIPRDHLIRSYARWEATRSSTSDLEEHDDAMACMDTLRGLLGMSHGAILRAWEVQMRRQAAQPSSN